MENPTATLRPVRLEIPRPVRGRPSYAWVDGFEIITPKGARLAPYMRKREARAFCRAQGWAFRVTDQANG